MSRNQEQRDRPLYDYEGASLILSIFNSMLLFGGLLAIQVNVLAAAILGLAGGSALFSILIVLLFVGDYLQYTRDDR